MTGEVIPPMHDTIKEYALVYFDSAYASFATNLVVGSGLIGADLSAIAEKAMYLGSAAHSAMNEPLVWNRDWLDWNQDWMHRLLELNPLPRHTSGSVSHR